MSDDFPRRRAATRGFRLGAPRNFTITPDGQRVLFLRSCGPEDPHNDLWLARLDDATGTWQEERIVAADTLLAHRDETLTQAEQARRERMREVSAGITSYSVDDGVTVAAMVVSGLLWVHEIDPGTTRRLGGATGDANPAVDPTGTRVAVTRAGGVDVVDIADGTRRTLLEPDSETAGWGVAEFVASEEMDRHEGLWWAPDGDRLLATRVDEAAVATWWIADPARPEHKPAPHRYPACGTANAKVSLHVVDLDGDTTAVQWDSVAYEYLARVSWSRYGDPVIAVQNRTQSTLLTLGVDPATGASYGLDRGQDDRWVELIPGLPRLTSGGLALARVDETADCRRLLVRDNSGEVVATTPDWLQLRAVAADDAEGVVLVGSGPDLTTSDLYRLRFDGELVRLSEGGGWSVGTARGGTTVVVRADLTEPRSSATVLANGSPWIVPSNAETPPVTIRPEFIADDTGWHRIAVLWPSTAATEPLPVVMSPYGGPHAQRSIRAAGAFATEQWLADQGFCVVVADGPGAPSRPSNEYAIFRDLGYQPLEGQVTALLAVLQHYGERLDRNRVAIRGWSFGGYLAAFAVMERPDLFAAGIAGAPVTDWTRYDTHYTERYLGTPDSDPAAHAHATLLNKAHRLHRPLLLIHGMADDNVYAAHTLQLSRELLAAGKPHTVLPLSGETHLTRQLAISENQLRLELAFLRDALNQPASAPVDVPLPTVDVPLPDAPDAPFDP